MRSSNKKGQGEFRLAHALSDSSTDKRSSTESLTIVTPLPKDDIRISLFKYIVKSGTHKSLLPAFMCSISTPRAGFELASDLSVEDRFIQLSYRGVLSFDNRTSNFDNLSINDDLVKGECYVRKNFS